MSKDSKDSATPDVIAQRKAWFKSYTSSLENTPELSLRCPCCYNQTLGERSSFDICPVCYWEDDGQDDYDADTIRGGPNGSLSLTTARANFREFGACDKRFINSVRPPNSDEIPK